MSYVGRFAPSPSGPLHAGSLLAALGSALDALHHGGVWLLRMDDLDPQRCKDVFESTILAQLAAHGFVAPLSLSHQTASHQTSGYSSADAPHRPNPMLRQSQRAAIYREAIDDLRQRGLIFACDCPRKLRSLQTDACCERGCRSARRDPDHSALRADLTRLSALRLFDRSLGEITFDPERHRDVIVWRRDNIAAYHLAVVVDDAAQGITDVVRGADLAASVPWQMALQGLLELPQPRYLHLPVLTERDGRKLSKSDHATPLNPTSTTATLRRALSWLRQDTPPNALEPKEMIAWAATRWQPQRFQGVGSVPIA